MPKLKYKNGDQWDEIGGDVAISQEAGNIITEKADGLYAKDSDVAISQEAGNIIEEKADGLYAKDSGVTLSKDPGNIITEKADGLYASQAGKIPASDAEALEKYKENNPGPMYIESGTMLDISSIQGLDVGKYANITSIVGLLKDNDNLNMNTIPKLKGRLPDTVAIVQNVKYLGAINGGIDGRIFINCRIDLTNSSGQYNDCLFVNCTITSSAASTSNRFDHCTFIRCYVGGVGDPGPTNSMLFLHCNFDVLRIDTTGPMVFMATKFGKLELVTSSNKVQFSIIYGQEPIVIDSLYITPGYVGTQGFTETTVTIAAYSIANANMVLPTSSPVIQTPHVVVNNLIIPYNNASSSVASYTPVKIKGANMLIIKGNDRITNTTETPASIENSIVQGCIAKAFTQCIPRAGSSAQVADTADGGWNRIG